MDAVGDIVTENENEGLDSVQSSTTYTLTANVESLILTGVNALNGTGNTLNNVLTGNSGNNVLEGREGNDNLIGGVGNDTLDGGIGADTLTGGKGNDTYVVDDINDVVIEDEQIGDIIRVSTDSNGNQADSISINGVLSADGKKVVFQSGAYNLVENTPSNTWNMFIKDLATGVVTLLSSENTQPQPNLNNSSKIVFQSSDDNLVVGDTNGVPDLFVKDLVTGVITRISTDALGNQANGSSGGAKLSDDGKKVLFSSYASNLVPDDTNNVSDLFLKDLVTGSITRVSTSSNGAQIAPYTLNSLGSSFSLSADGSKVAFSSGANNLVLNDTNDQIDLFVKDLVTGIIKQVSTDSNGIQGNGYSDGVMLSDDGTKIVFHSHANNLVINDTNNAVDIFMKDLSTGVLTLVSTNRNGEQANYQSFNSVLSADGTKVAFQSLANNLVDNDTNGLFDIFVKDLVSGIVTHVTTDGITGQANSLSLIHI